jgi:antitoxin YefM
VASLTRAGGAAAIKLGARGALYATEATIPITEAKARIAELADRVAREHDHFTITRNGRADVMLISVAEYESMQETLDILSDEETLADLRQSREDFAAGDTFDAGQVRAELERRRHGTP